MKTNFFLAISLLTYGAISAQVNLPNGTPEAAGSPGIDNVYIGGYAGADPLNSSNWNVFTGYKAGFKNSTGYSNVFTGYIAGTSNTIGTANVFIGSQSGKLNTSGSHNVFTGFTSGYSNVVGKSNSFYGYGSGNLSTGDSNVFVGYNSGSGATGSYNVCFGGLTGLKSGNNNVYIGNEAGNSSMGNGNVFIGNQAGKTETGSNLLYITNKVTPNPLIHGDFTANELKFNAQKVGIGLDFGPFPAMTTISNASSYRLFVRGGILAEEVRIRLQTDWADYVFSKDYKLLSLADTEQYINENGHLPNMPSAAQVKEEGIEMGNIIKLQQEKIEELTLHLIEQDKKMEELKAQVQLLLNK